MKCMILKICAWIKHEVSTVLYCYGSDNKLLHIFLPDEGKRGTQLQNSGAKHALY